MDALLEKFFNLSILRESWPVLLRGLGMTLKLCALVIPPGLLGGLVVALLATSRYRALRWAMVPFVDLFRAVSPLVLLIFVHTGLPFAGFSLTAFQSVAMPFSSIIRPTTERSTEPASRASDGGKARQPDRRG